MTVRARLDSGIAGVGGESFWAAPVAGQPGQYVVASLLFFAPFTLGDTVSVIEHDGLFDVTGVVARSTRVSILLGAVPREERSPQPGTMAELDAVDALQALADSATTVGCNVEGGFGMLSVQLPEGAVETTVNSDTLPYTIPVVTTILTQAGPRIDLNAFSMEWQALSAPGDPLGMAPGLLAPEPQDHGDPDVVPYDPWADMAEWLAAFNALNTEYGTDIDSGELVGRVIAVYDHDDRVRVAIAAGNFTSVATMVWRVAVRLKGLPLPPLDGPIFPE